MEDYLIGIGKRIKEIRKENKNTISDIALEAQVSNGLISRIENGRTIPSLPVLLNIIAALGIEVPEFFNGMPHTHGKGFIISREADNTAIEKEDEATGFSYKYIFGKQLPSVAFESVLLEISPGSQRGKVTTDAYEYKYILSGACTYVIGDEELNLFAGDAVFFDGRIPHVPVNRTDKVVKMLVLYFFI